METLLRNLRIRFLEAKLALLQLERGSLLDCDTSYALAEERSRVAFRLANLRVAIDTVRFQIVNLDLQLGRSGVSAVSVLCDS